MSISSVYLGREDFEKNCFCKCYQWMWLLWYMPEMFPGKNCQRALTKSWFYSSGWKYFPVNPGIKDIIQTYYCSSAPIFSAMVFHAGHASVMMCFLDFGVKYYYLSSEVDTGLIKAG